MMFDSDSDDQKKKKLGENTKRDKSDYTKL